MKKDEHWWWLSFADKDLGFLGAVLVWAEDFKDAHLKVTMLGLNPGGAVKGFLVKDEIAYATEAPFKPEDHCNKLLSKQYINEKMGGARKF